MMFFLFLLLCYLSLAFSLAFAEYLWSIRPGRGYRVCFVCRWVRARSRRCRQCPHTLPLNIFYFFLCGYSEMMLMVAAHALALTLKKEEGKKLLASPSNFHSCLLMSVLCALLFFRFNFFSPCTHEKHYPESCEQRSNTHTRTNTKKTAARKKKKNETREKRSKPSYCYSHTESLVHSSNGTLAACMSASQSHHDQRKRIPKKNIRKKKRKKAKK